MADDRVYLALDRDVAESLIYKKCGSAKLRLSGWARLRAALETDQEELVERVAAALSKAELRAEVWVDQGMRDEAQPQHFDMARAALAELAGEGG